MRRERRSLWALRGAVRGVVAATAMTGMRQVTTGLGLIRRTPPEAIVESLGEDTAPGLMARVPEGRRQAATELLHWAYGAAGGVAFAALPSALRRRPWCGPAYGLAVWAAFEAAIAPAIGLKEGERAPAERVFLAVDHMLYGAILGTEV